MKRRTLTFLTFAWVLCAVAPGSTRAGTTYPTGTSMEEAWLSAPRISAADAADLLAKRLLTRQASGTEVELSPEEIEAFKYLVGNHVHSVAEEPAGDGRRLFTGEIDSASMTDEDDAFFGALSFALVRRLGLTALESPDACVAQKRLWEVTKYRYDLGWNEVEVWGITAFGHNVQYGVNHSDVIYGVFPFGVRMTWWEAAKCAWDKPDDEEGLQACGTAKAWKIHGDTQMVLSSRYDTIVPGVAQASLTYAGALVSGEADQFRTHEQTRAPGDASWLLGPANTPLPSAMHAWLGCPNCEGGVPIDARYQFSRVLAWSPDIVLNASYNSLVPRPDEVFRYQGQGDGNPHGLKTWHFSRPFSRFHEPLPGCN